MKKVICVVCLLYFCVALVGAQNKNAVRNIRVENAATSLEEMLAAREKQKWEALANGRWLELKEWFAEDFVSIGYQPDGSVKMMNKTETFATTGTLPAGINFTLGDFKKVSADKKNIIITYKADGPIKVQAASHWTKRGKNWQTVFYQATMIR